MPVLLPTFRATAAPKAGDLVQQGPKGDEQLDDDHVLPIVVPSVALPKFVMPQPENEAREIRRYVEIEAPDETVTHLEKIKTEAINDQRMDVWDVHTDRSRWWVITNLTNLYSQEHFPSLDYTLSFHVGLMARIAAHQGHEPDDRRKRVAAAWRRVDQADDSLDLADEAEEFQAVGMRCREALIAFVKAVQDQSMVPTGEDVPKGSDFVRWSELIANTIADGRGAASVRGFLKSVAKSTWQLVGWLTHAENAVRHDADLAVGATTTVLGAYTNALMRHESGLPDRCPKCKSYRVMQDFRPDLDLDPPYVKVCNNCDWSEPPEIS